MKLGRLHVAGAQAWPDHVLSFETGNLIVGVVVQVRSWAFGFEVQGWHSREGAVWAYVYVGPWAFEVYLDREGEYEDSEAVEGA